MSQWQQDVAMIALIAAFSFIKAALIVREGWLGRALCWANISYGIGFSYAVAVRFYPHIGDDLKIIGGIRLLIATALGWALVQLFYSRYLRWRNGGDDPRRIMWLRELVVGRREGVATRREGAVTRREDRMDDMKGS